ncbi:MAG: PASTA domain-containing protein [Halobacteriovoraceae bacterium]|jgi:cell division protein FtsI (penicillin-binding protein 3)|nr:PASTA domain-containing protein [Halobacteriovoraceae bacterium]
MKAKITGIFLLFILLFVTVLAKAFYIQVVNRDKLIAYSESQIVRKTKIFPKRGFILDRNENPLAINVQKYNIFTFGKNEKKLARELKQIKKILKDLNIKKIVKSVKKRKKFTWIRREIELSKEDVQRIKKFKSIFIESQSSRFYPNHELLAQTLGFVGIDNDGLAGIEYQFNDKLQGEPEIYKYFKDAKGRPVKFKSANFDKRAKDITLSIDKDIQLVLEDSLKEGVLKHDALKGGAAVMDATTGEIWAIANYPAFDPNQGRKSKNKKLSFITDPFEPGSVFKTITIASAMENNIVREDTSYFCERGKLKVGNHYIRESDSNHGYEWLSVTDILKFSSNIGTTKIAFDLTYPNLKKTLNKFSLGKKTNIEIPGESRGILDQSENITPLRLSNISFGQGVATTGIQMMASYAPFANGGYYVKPTLLKISKENKIQSKRIIKQETAESITEMLRKAVEDGTGKSAKVRHYSIAGKTSTAQRADAEGGYSGYVAGFIGYPVNVDKKFIVFVYVDNPKNGYYGNTVAAPIFQKIVKSILYKDKVYSRLANVENDKDTKVAMDNINIKYSSKRIIEKGKVPNLVGLDKTSAFKVLDGMEASYDHVGFGIVKSQSPEAGSIMSDKTMITLKFRAPLYDGE